MSPEELALWREIRREPAKWTCSRWGDLGGGFWVVAVIEQTVVWFNDIEHGFNVSGFTQPGVIDEYWCNQDELQWVVRRLTVVAPGDKEAVQLQRLKGPHARLDADQLAAVWGCLHDGEIEAISVGDRTAFSVSCRYISETLGRPKERVVIEVSGPVRWDPWDDAAARYWFVRWDSPTCWTTSQTS